MSKNILEALGGIDVALGGQKDDALNIIQALDQISDGVGALKTSVDDINSMEIKILRDDEYNSETGVPTVENPVKGTFYLTPAKNEEDNNMFNEYYINDDGEWEMFGGASIDVNSLFDLSDRMAKGIDDNGNVVTGAIIEGNLSNKASGSQSHAEGGSTTASGQYSHAEGGGTTASGVHSHAEGYFTTASGQASHVEGSGGTFTLNNIQYISGAKNTSSHSEGYQTAAEGQADHTEGYQTRTAPNTQPGNHAEGYQTAAIGGASHAEGSGTKASGNGSHAEGNGTIASGTISHAEGSSTTASGNWSHAEGTSTKASGNQSHAEGGGTTASGTSSHAEGNGTTASGDSSHAEGYSTTASGGYSHAEGLGTTANHAYQHVFGEYNIVDPSTAAATARGNYIEIVGNGTSLSEKSNARTLDWSGNESLAGSLTLGLGTANQTTITAAQLSSLISLIGIESEVF